MRYIYALVRYVPDPFREEFVNVGAIVGSEQTGEWEIFQVSNLQRARALQERPKTILAVSDFIDHYASMLDPWTSGLVDESDDPEPFIPTENWVHELHQANNTVVQLSTPLPVGAESLDDAIHAVTSRFLVDPARQHIPYRKRTHARTVARELYVQRGIKPGETLFEAVLVRTERASERLDFAVVNGKALQVTQAWSFQLPRQDELTERIKAWGWSLSRVRQHGGFIDLDGRTVEVPERIDIAVVYVPPMEGTSSPALDAARGVFDDLEIRGAPIDDAEEVADRAAALLGSVS